MYNHVVFSSEERNADHGRRRHCYIFSVAEYENLHVLLLETIHYYHEPISLEMAHIKMCRSVKIYPKLNVYFPFQFAGLFCNRTNADVSTLFSGL